MKDDDIDHFIQKATLIQQTIDGLANGTLKEDNIDLRDHGIYTPEQQKEEDEKQAKAKKEREEKLEQRKGEERERERQHWWDGAIFMYGPREGDFAVNEECEGSATEKAQDDTRSNDLHSIQKRYSSDYSRWNDSAYKPDDEATREEEKLQKETLEKLQNDEFEKANKEWCDQVKQDFLKREESIQKREESAEALRLKGNKFFRKKKHAEALKFYLEALEKTPYAVNILTNIAIVHMNMKSWDEVLEYSNRAVHVDKNCLKGYYYRHKALIAMDDDKAALVALNRCIQLDPDNEKFHHNKTLLYQKIDCDEITADIQRVAIDQKSFNFNQTQFPSQFKILEDCSMSLNVPMFIVKCDRHDKLYDSMIKHQFECVDLCMDFFETFGYSDNILEGEDRVTKTDDNNLFKLFMHVKIKNCSIARRYMWQRGYVDHMLNRIVTIYKSYTDGTITLPMKDSAKFHVVEITREIGIFSELDMILDKHKAVEIFHDFFKQEPKDLDDVCLFAAAGQFISTVVMRSGFKQIRKYGELLPFICSNLRLCCENEVPSFFERCKLISSCADMLSAIFGDPKLSKKVSLSSLKSDKDNLVTCLLSNANLSNKQKQRPTFSAVVTEMRTSIIKAVFHLTTVYNTRKLFEVDAEKTYGILLEFTLNNRFETGATQEMALISLTNLVNSINEKSTIYNVISKAIHDRDLLPKLIKTYNDRSYTFLSCLVSKSIVELNSEHTNKIWEMFKFVAENMQNEFIPKSSMPDGTIIAHPEDAKSHSTIASNLLKITVVSVRHVNWSRNHVDAVVIINLLPTPRTNARGLIDSQSVCQPPEKPSKDTPIAFAYKTSIFCANLLNLLIQYLDAQPEHHQFIFSEGGVERLVSLLANSDQYHEKVTKNAATALARLVKNSDVAMQRCRELRGMEILLELGQLGRI